MPLFIIFLQISLPFGVRTISTPNGTHGINHLEDFEDGHAYVCSDKKTVKPISLNQLKAGKKPPWFIRYVRTFHRINFFLFL